MGLALQKARFVAGESKLNYPGLCKLLTRWRSASAPTGSWHGEERHRQSVVWQVVREHSNRARTRAALAAGWCGGHRPGRGPICHALGRHLLHPAQQRAMRIASSRNPPKRFRSHSGLPEKRRRNPVPPGVGGCQLFIDTGLEPPGVSCPDSPAVLMKTMVIQGNSTEFSAPWADLLGRACGTAHCVAAGCAILAPHRGAHSASPGRDQPPQLKRSSTPCAKLGDNSVHEQR